MIDSGLDHRDCVHDVRASAFISIPKTPTRARCGDESEDARLHYESIVSHMV